MTRTDFRKTIRDFQSNGEKFKALLFIRKVLECSLYRTKKDLVDKIWDTNFNICSLLTPEELRKLRTYKDPDKLNITEYVITGTLRNGKRFTPIHTTTPQHYNIWKGTLWGIVDGKRIKLRNLAG